MNDINKWLWAVFAALLSPAFVLAQSVDVYVPISSERITASASSEHRGFPAVWAVDGSGMGGCFHKSDNQGLTMWISGVSRSPVRANPHTHEGIAWFMAEFDRVEKGVDLIELWNHNQSQHTHRGLQKIYVEYSIDGREWKLLKNGNADYFIVPEAAGRRQEAVSLGINTGGVDMKYFCITADLKNGNWYHDSRPETLRQAQEMQQNPDYYGLAEIRFSRRERVAVQKLPKIGMAHLIPTQGYLKTEQGPAREFTVVFDSLVYCGGKVTIDIGGKSAAIAIPASPTGIISVNGVFPAGYMEEAVEAAVKFTSRQGSLEYNTTVPAARQWELWFLPHSHLDIGYTHRQADVMRLQWRNLERAVELAERTKDYPAGSRYKWNAEATWPTMGYLEEYGGTDKADRLLEAIRRGDIGMDATLGSILTGISKQEELMHIFDDAHRIARLTGTEVNTAMMSDVPGQSWGFVNAMAQNGVRYFSSGPNYVPYLGRMGSYGVGLYNLLLGDEPFWWHSASGSEKVLYWQTGKGYSLFHGWLADKLSVCGTEPVWGYLAELEDKDFPYGMTYLRYTIHGDNGPPDEQMPDVIREWNEKYESPKFVIGTTKELFTEFERKYGDHLPVYSGDMTPVWEDGAASTARELAMNRASSERLNQAEILWSMNRPAEEFPAEDFLDGWKNAVLFSEHTWGASASGPEPESQFTKDLWAGKKLYADNADAISRKLYAEALASETSSAVVAAKPVFIEVFNTNLWKRSDVVRVTGVDLTGMMLLSGDGSMLPVQKMNDGSWAFFAQGIDGLSSALYRIVADKRKAKPASMRAENNILDNGRVRVVVDGETGKISSFTVGEREYASEKGLNAYLYSGRGGGNEQQAGPVESIGLPDDGEVAATLRIVSAAPGCRSLVRDVTVYRDIDRVDIVNTVDKLDILDHENVRFAFLLNFPNPEVTMDLAMAEMYPERDQIRGSNKNFYSILNGLSVCDIEHGIYLTGLDSPFVELGSPTADRARLAPRGTGWLNSSTISPAVSFWVMNNRWRTNYKASQGGVATFRYSLEAYDPMERELKKRGIERAQPLVAVPTSDGIPVGRMFRMKGTDNIAVSTIRPSADETGYIVRLQNMSARSVCSSIEWGTMQPAGEVLLCDNTEKVLGVFDAEKFWLKPYDCVTIKIAVKK